MFHLTNPPPPPTTDIPSPHCHSCHTTTTRTDHHRTKAQRFAPTHRMNRRRKVHLLAGTPAPASTVISTQQTESSADLAAPVQRGGRNVGEDSQKNKLGVSELNHHLKGRGGGFGIAREGTCQNKHHGGRGCLRIQGKIHSQSMSMAAATNAPNNWWGIIILVSIGS